VTTRPPPESCGGSCCELQRGRLQMNGPWCVYRAWYGVVWGTRAGHGDFDLVHELLELALAHALPALQRVRRTDQLGVHVGHHLARPCDREYINNASKSFSVEN